MRTTLALAAVLSTGVLSHAQVPPAAPQPQPSTPPSTQPAPASPAQPAIPAPVTPTVPLNPRAFAGQAGMMFSAVRPERLLDFETAMTYVQEAARTTTDASLRRQWQGLKILKATEPGPNSSVLYVLVIDPVVMGADYTLAPLLTSVYPAEKVGEVMKLYLAALIQQSVVNLNAFVPPALPPAAAPSTAPPPAAAPPPARGQ